MRKVLGLLFFMTALTTSAQTIDSQFDSLRAKSNSWKQFKVIPRADLIKLQEATDKRIAGLKDSISDLSATITEKDKSISDLESELAETQTDRDTAIAQKQTLDVAGIEVDKTFYNTLVCGIIAGLIVVLVILGIRYKSSHAVARDAEKQLKTTEDELEELRRKSIEEQQRLGRQLQDERNKLARLKNQ